jgi:two-component system, cell cycle sensor histidine kinase and response regulator CckA
MSAILVVDDDHAVLKLVKSCLRIHGFQALTATSAHHARQLFERQPDTIALLLTDIRMPETDGPTLARALLDLKPDLPVLFMSGFTEDDWPETAFIRRFAFIGKPFTPGLLIRTLREMLASERGAPADNLRKPAR